MIDVPDDLVRTVCRTWPDEGPGWIATLDTQVGGLAGEWGLDVGAPYPLTFHWVAPVRCADGTAAVLKLGVPDGHLDSEAAALRAFGGNGCVALLLDDRERGGAAAEARRAG